MALVKNIAGFSSRMPRVDADLYNQLSSPGGVYSYPPVRTRIPTVSRNVGYIAPIETGGGSGASDSVVDAGDSGGVVITPIDTGGGGPVISPPNTGDSGGIVTTPVDTTTTTDTTTVPPPTGASAGGSGGANWWWLLALGAGVWYLSKDSGKRKRVSGPTKKKSGSGTVLALAGVGLLFLLLKPKSSGTTTTTNTGDGGGQTSPGLIDPAIVSYWVQQGIPGDVFGRMTQDELNAVSTYTESYVMMHKWLSKVDIDVHVGFSTVHVIGNPVLWQQIHDINIKYGISPAFLIIGG